MEKQIEYKLKFLLESTTLNHRETKDILSKEDLNRFNEVYANTKIVELYCTEIGEQSVFPVTKIPINPSETTHKVYLCQVAVGNPKYVTKAYLDGDQESQQKVDSLITNYSDEDGFISKDANINDFYYIINDKSRILPLYEISFDYDAEFEKVARNKSVCMKCKGEAILYCPSERASLCGKCDKLIHNDELLQRHFRFIFAETNQKKYITCVSHPTKVVEFFCNDCSLPMCSYCKIDGSHGSVEMATHKISTFADAGKSLGNKINEVTPKIKGQLKSLDEEMKKVDANINSFTTNIELLNEEIEKEFKRLKGYLDCIQCRVTQNINSELLEMLKLKDLLERVSEFPNILDVTDKIQYYKTIMLQRKVEFYPINEVKKVESYSLEGKVALLATSGKSTRNATQFVNEDVLQKRLESSN